MNDTASSTLAEAIPSAGEVRGARYAKIATDVLILLVSTPLAFGLRFDGAIPDPLMTSMALATVVLFGAKLAGYVYLKLHAHSWSKIAFRDLGPMTGLLVTVAGVATMLTWALAPWLAIPRTLPLIDALITLVALVGVRAGARFLHERRRDRAVASDKRRRVMVAGAGEAGAMAVRELLRHPETGMMPVAFVDDDPAKQGRRVAGVDVMGTVADAPRIIDECHIDEVLIAMPSENGMAARRVVDAIKQQHPNMPHKILPGMYEVLSGRVDVKRIRDVKIEDLLGRPPVKLDTEAIHGYLKGKRVMIVGAGGSIGSELVRQICPFQPGELILFGHGENSIYSLERELDRDWPEINYRSVIAAIQNGARLDYVFSHYRPDVVFHSAAHKHVPLMELNPEEAIFNNVIGSRNLIDQALQHGVSHFVNISTDKAVNPSSVMGASKRMVEYLVQEASSRAGPDQVFVSVRFGNVLGSRGSVLPVFKSQIEAGGPVTVTHPEVVRYFMTVPEAAQLVLQASGQGRNGDVYILDMGEPVNIYRLACDLIRLSGLEPEVDIPIVFTGMRPGEKLYEELMVDKERTNRTPHEKIFVASVEPADSKRLHEMIEELEHAALRSDHERIRLLLQAYIDGCRFEYRPEQFEPQP